MPTLRVHKTPPGPRARALLQRMQQCVAPSATHPYPLVVDHASGCYVWDVDGNCYLDFTAGIAVSAAGHGHKQVLGSIKAQADRLLHFSFADFFYPSYVHLAERLAQLAPGRDPKQVFLCNSGAEAIEAAIKLARHATRRPYLLATGKFQGVMRPTTPTGSRIHWADLFGSSEDTTWPNRRRPSPAM